MNSNSGNGISHKSSEMDVPMAVGALGNYEVMPRLRDELQDPRCSAKGTISDLKTRLPGWS
jgi:hypothetical protein